MTEFDQNFPHITRITFPVMWLVIYALFGFGAAVIAYVLLSWVLLWLAVSMDVSSDYERSL